MSDPTARYALLAYFVVYFLAGFAWRWWVVYRRTGINPVVFPHGKDARSNVARGLKLLAAGCGIVLAVHVFFPGQERWLGLYPPLQRPGIFAFGWLLLLVSLAVLVVAQAQMGNAWRVGIDAERPTDLVAAGLYRYSRNPIYVALRATLLGLFLVLPSTATLALWVAGEVLLELQVRLEEQHLLALHGDAYAAYCRNVRRWL